MKYPRPILITGCPRSGTTFVGTILALPAEIGYIREPFNIDYGLNHVSHTFPYLYKGAPDEATYRRLITGLLDGRPDFRRLPARAGETFRRRLGRLIMKSGSNFSYQKARFDPRVKRLLLKDPMAVLASAYLADEFDAEVIALVRHPTAVIASMKRLGIAYPLADLKRQPLFYDQYVRPLLGKTQPESLTALQNQALLWNSLNLALDDFRRDRPNFKLVRYEAIAYDPEAAANQLATNFEVTYGPAQVERLRRLSAPGNTGRIEHGPMHNLYRDSRRLVTDPVVGLSDDELQEIAALTDRVVKRFYPEEWPPTVVPELVVK